MIVLALEAMFVGASGPRIEVDADKLAPRANWLAKFEQVDHTALSLECELAFLKEPLDEV